jgi:hypothetical protein
MEKAMFSLKFKIKTVFLFILTTFVLSGDFALAVDYSDPLEVSLQKIKYEFSLNSDGVRKISCSNISENYLKVLKENEKLYSRKVDSTNFSVFGVDDKDSAESICKINRKIKDRYFVICDGYLIINRDNGDYVGRMDFSRYVELIFENGKYLFCPKNLEKSLF